MSGGEVWADREPSRASLIAEWNQAMFGSVIESEIVWTLKSWAQEAVDYLQARSPGAPRGYPGVWAAGPGSSCGSWVVEWHEPGKERRRFEFGYHSGVVFSESVVKAALWDLIPGGIPEEQGGGAEVALMAHR